MKLSNRTFIVTGAASGLGEAVTRRFHAQGAQVVIADLNETTGQALAKELGDRALFVKTDVADEASAQHCINAAVKAYQQINGLVNCAGIPGAERILGRDGIHRLETFSRAINVNLIGTFNMLRFAAEQMQHNAPGDSNERGVIINTASVAAFDGQVGQAGYSASKGGVCAMTLPIARELANFGIRVVTIAPGLFKTPMMAALPEEVQDSLGQSVPFPKRLGEPDEYAQLAQQIVENMMINGEVIRLDGAIRMAAR
jgi:NAD(P)-dependent dehydrogenase (short-subunit alcohol dehydrogenase family)